MKSYSKYLLIATTVFFGLLGIVLIFLPDELLVYYEIENHPMLALLCQLAGAIHFAIAMLNWMNKEKVIGGIYNRPLAVTNFTYLFIAGISAFKYVMGVGEITSLVGVLTAIYLLLGLLYLRLLFTHPLPADSKE